MGRIFTGNAATEHLQVGTAVVTAYPLTVSVWGWADNATANHTLFWVGDPAVAAHFHAVDLGGAAVGDPARAFSFAGGTAAIASSTTAYNANAWNHVGAVFASATDRSVTLNGAGKGTDATSRTPANMARTCLGRRADSTPSDPLTGRIAECAVWNVVLSDSELAQLAGGASPLGIQSGNLISYWQVAGDSSPEPDSVGALDLTVTGTLTQTPGPFGSGSLQTLSIAGTLTASGTILRLAGKAVAGTITAAGSAVRSTARQLAGAVASSGSVSAGLLGTFATKIRLLVSRTLGFARPTMLAVAVARSSMRSISVQASAQY